MKTIHTRLTDADHNDRQIPVPVPNSEKFYNADAVVIAFGFRPSPASWFDNFQIALKGNGLIKTNIDEENYEFQTSNEKIFSGGDMVRGSDLVVTAVWEGREAAKNIIGFLICLYIKICFHTSLWYVRNNKSIKNCLRT